MGKSIHVNMPDFKIEAQEDGKTIKTIDSCAFGREGHLTPIIKNGSLSMTKRDREHHSSLYHNALMPYALFFEEDPACAFHQGDVTVASHGCIHLGAADAKWLFEWAAKDPVALQMSGPYPGSPTRKA